ncbi:Hypothetical protein, putative [Bodo saltans]|uniref:Uncharacterized protein n=1 Tax=Bodo saltans TaxID=75058 RepID=A0A0S4IRW7_BODSA|nr:Hypothetical protein, putative [Bodo saltans]|eukprot:CUF43117.1 Hypothetical protein, putative [Bodo saltans]
MFCGSLHAALIDVAESQRSVSSAIAASLSSSSFAHWERIAFTPGASDELTTGQQFRFEALLPMHVADTQKTPFAMQQQQQRHDASFARRKEASSQYQGTNNCYGEAVQEDKKQIFSTPSDVFRAADENGSPLYRQINSMAANAKTWWGVSPLGAVALHHQHDGDNDDNNEDDDDNPDGVAGRLVASPSAVSASDAKEPMASRKLSFGGQALVESPHQHQKQHATTTSPSAVSASDAKEPMASRKLSFGGQALVESPHQHQKQHATTTRHSRQQVPLLPTLHYRVGVYVGTNSLLVFDAAGAHVASVPFSSLVTIGWRPSLSNTIPLEGDSSSSHVNAMKFRKEFAGESNVHNSQNALGRSSNHDAAATVALAEVPPALPYAELEIITGNVTFHRDQPNDGDHYAHGDPNATAERTCCVDIVVVLCGAGVDGVQHLNGVKSQLEERWAAYLSAGGAERSSVLQSLAAAAVSHPNDSSSSSSISTTSGPQHLSIASLVTTGSPLMRRSNQQSHTLFEQQQQHGHHKEEGLLGHGSQHRHQQRFWKPPTEAILYSRSTYGSISRDEYNNDDGINRRDSAVASSSRRSGDTNAPQEQLDIEAMSPWRQREVRQEQLDLQRATRKLVLNATSLAVAPLSSTLRRDLASHHKKIDLEYTHGGGSGAPSHPSAAWRATAAETSGLDIDISVIGPTVEIPVAVPPGGNKAEDSHLHRAYEVMLQQQDRRKRQQQLRDSTTTTRIPQDDISRDQSSDLWRAVSTMERVDVSLITSTVLPPKKHGAPAAGPMVGGDETHDMQASSSIQYRSGTTIIRHEEQNEKKISISPAVVYSPSSSLNNFHLPPPSPAEATVAARHFPSSAGRTTTTTSTEHRFISSPLPTTPLSTQPHQSQPQSSTSRIEYPLTCVRCGTIFDLRFRADHLRTCTGGAAS